MKSYEDFADFSLKWENQEDWLLPNVLEHQAEAQGDRTFLQWETDGETISFEETNRIVNRLAHGLVDQGIEKGDHVLLMLPNSLEYLYLWFALSKIGAVEVPVNTDYKQQSLSHVANLTEASFGIFDEEYVSRLTDIEGDLDYLETVAVKGDESAAAGLELERLEYDALVSDDDRNPDVALDYHDVASIIMTSGTTGPSKAIQKTYSHQYFFSEECRNLVQLSEDDVYMTGNPLFHSNAQVLVVYPALIAGAKVCLFGKFSGSDWVDRLHETGATVCNFLGSMMDFVYQQPERDIDDQNDLRCLFAAPTATGIKEEFQERFSVEYITEVYGSTEISLPVLTPYGVDRPDGAAGLLLEEFYDVELKDPKTDQPVEAGKMGEFATRPRIPWITTPGYYGMPEKTVEASRNHWFHTEDGLRQDDDGWFYFVDRIGDTLRRRGENISSYEVEQPILEHEAVEEVAVVGVPASEEGGEEEVKAFVVFKSEMTATEEELIEWCAERLPSFMVPRYLEDIDELPKTSNEKIQKKDLRERGNTDKTWDRKSADIALTQE
ncbi:AMP-binding protein [Natrinema gelatinilyticum]|uniref:AMP-binding protein n=1 Tax=Natrinema gelatinilyticum TaxID=2961571 RepID=UPI0020C30CD9|nr:AMP-binding protein [Natrinema gelatinilyticum]